MKNRKLWLLLLATLLLAACRVDLYTQLDEVEANQMMALLLAHDIDCDKLPGKEDRWVLRVPRSQVTAAVERLESEGFPKKRFQSIGDIFQKEGLVSSPLTERVRFVYALSQELSHTISRIDGVLDARVHVVLPDNDPLATRLTPSSASVFVRYRADSPIKDSIPQIKQLVVHSIEGLSYDNVSVAIFPSTMEPATVEEEPVFLATTLTFGISLTLLLGFLVLLFRRLSVSRRTQNTEVTRV